MAAGRFTIETSPSLPDDFNLEQIQGDPPPPDDQWNVCTDVYKTKNVLWLLKTRGAFAGDDDAFKSYLERLKLAAQTGCVYNPVVPAQAQEALIEIRDDIVARKGRPAKYRYLTRVAFWAAAFIAVALLAMNGLRELPQVTLPPFAVGVAWAVCGGVIGAWISLAATRRQISFDEMPQYLDFKFEPFIRLLFVAALAFALALLLHLKVVTIIITSQNLAEFTTKPSVALLLGLVAGIGEKAVTVQVVDRLRKVVAK